MWLRLVRHVLMGAAALVLATGAANAAGEGSATKRSDAVVKATATADKPSAGGKQVTVTLAVNKDWHIYANPVGNENFIPIQTTVTVEGKSDAHIDYPEGRVIKDSLIGNYTVYDGTIAIKVTVPRSGEDNTPLKLKVKFQACNEKGTCLAPAAVELTAP